MMNSTLMEKPCAENPHGRSQLYKNILACFVLGWTTLLSADTILYVKPGGTGDGSNWANAANLANTVETAREGSKVVTIYAAKGVYTLTATLKLNSNVALYGGFAGASMDETPATRDLTENPTILSGDVNGDGVWTRYYPLTGTSKVTEEPIVKDGKINDLSLANLYDTYAPANKNHSDNLIRVVTVMESTAATCILDGVTITGGGKGIGTGDGTVEDGFRRDRGSSLFVASGATPIVRNCRIVGNTAFCSCVFFNSSTPTFEDNEISHNQSYYYGAAYANSSSATHLRTAFIGNVRDTDGNCNGGAALELNRSLTVRNCTFTRNYLHKYRTNSPQEAVCVCTEYGDYSSFNLFDNTFHHNACYDTYGMHPAPLVYMYGDQKRMAGNTFASNVTTCVSSQTDIKVAGTVYMMGGRDEMAECTFVDNEISVTAASATSVAVAPIYGPGKHADCAHVIANCTFTGNTVTVSAPLATEKLVARAAVLAGETGTSFVFNSTFAGDEALPDIVYRRTGENASGLKVLNSVFWATGAAADVARIDNAGTADAMVGCSIVCRPDLLDDSVVLSESTDEDPLLQALSTPVAGMPPVMRLGARLPTVRDTYDVATFVYYNSTTYAYRRTPKSAWEHCFGSGGTKALLTDAIGATRTSGSFTIGAVQALTDKAENGLTIVYRMDPANVARLDGETVQVIDLDGTTVPVTGVSTNENYTFRRWRNEDGSTYSTENPLTVTASEAGTLVLTAQFNPSSVKYAFDLGEFATFDDDGTTIKVLTVEPDSTVTIPAYTMNDGFSFKGWSPEVPSVVGTLDASFALLAYRRDTYLNPGDDVAQAVSEAKNYPGDATVHFSAGEYELASAMALPTKVKLVGAAGTVIRRTNATAKDYWAIANPSESATADTGMIEVSGITFEGCGLSAGLSSAHIVDCVFTNCTYDSGTGVGCNGVVSFHNDSSVANKVVLVNCGIYNGACALRGWGNGNAGQAAYVTNCVFYGNCNSFDSHNGTPLGAAVALSGNKGVFYGCRFEKNFSNNPASDYGIIAGGNLYFDHCQIVDNVCTGDYNIVRKNTYVTIDCKHTLFMNNRVVGSRYSTTYAKYANQATGIVAEGAMGTISYDSCAFVSNLVDRTEETSAEGVTTLPCAIIAGHRAETMRYCVFEGNVVRATATNPDVKPICSVYMTCATTETSIEGNTFHDNTAATGAIYVYAETSSSGTLQNLWIWNALFYGTGAEATPVAFASGLTVPVHLRHTFAAVQDDARVVRDDTCKYGTLTFASKLVEKDGLWIRPLRDCFAARTKPVKWYLTSNGKKMYYNEDLKAYRRLNGDCWDSYMTQYTPYTTMTDMFGEVPEGSRACAGAYQTRVKYGMTILFK